MELVGGSCHSALPSKATHVGHTWQRQHVANDGKLPKEVEDDWEEISVERPRRGREGKAAWSVSSFRVVATSMLLVHVPEQIEEAETFHQHSNHGPLAEYEDHSGEEADRASDLLFPREEVECLLWADQQCDTGGEEDVAERKQRSVEKEEDASKDEEGAEGHQSSADL